MSEVLAQLLQELVGEGQLDSTDHFTLDWFRAQRTQQIFTRPSSFLLKLIQCAQSCGSSRLELRRQGPRLEAYFNTPKVTPRMLHQRSSLVLEHGGQWPLDYLIGAVRAAAQLSPKAIWWGCCGPEVGLGYVLRDQQISAQPLGGGRTHEFECFFAVEVEPGPWWRGWRGPWADLLKEARWLARFSSLLIELDGRPWWPRLDPTRTLLPWLCDRLYLAREPASELLTLPASDQFSAVAYDLGSQVCQVHSLGQAQTFVQQWRGYAGGEPDLFPPCRLPAAEPLVEVATGLVPPNHLLLRDRDRSYPYAVHSPWPDVTGSETGWGRGASLCARAWIRIPSAPGGEASTLSWVQHGVCLDNCQLTLPLREVEIYLADNAQPTDLAGFQVVRDARWWQVQHWLEGELQPLPAILCRLVRGLTQRQGVSRHWVKKTILEQNLDP